MKSTLWIIAFVLLLNIACSIKPTNNLNGTWQLVSSEVNANGAITHDKMEDKKMIKIINDTHFAFLNHDLKGGKDSTNVVLWPVEAPVTVPTAPIPKLWNTATTAITKA